MAGRVLHGVAASPGAVVGAARVLAPLPAEGSAAPVAPGERAAEASVAERALVAAAGQLERTAAGLREHGRADEAEIVETGALMAADPALHSAVVEAVRDDGLPAPDAILAATEVHAALIAGLEDPMLAARAEDVRSLGRRAARLAAGRDGDVAPDSGADAILVAEDLGPADVAELGPEVLGIALAAGSTTSHAAIVARSLGLPMVVGLGPDLLGLAADETLVVDAGNGVALLAPDGGEVAVAREAMVVRNRARVRASARRLLPAVTRDGRELRVLANAASAAEVAAALECGAQGAGLVRTELAFLDAREWPTEDEHRRALEPVLGALGERTATVRVLDFGADKTPPFLRGTREGGLRLLLSHPEALAAQLRAIVAAGRDCDLRVLLPMVTGSVQLVAARDAVHAAVAAVPGATMPAVGAMVELPRAAAAAYQLALESDFLSIGTNDLTCSTLQVDRLASADAHTHDPRVLRLIARTVDAARTAGIVLEVCGEAASDPLTMPLLVGLGADELSVGAARVGPVRDWVRALAFEEAQRVARRALQATSAREVAELATPLRRSLELLEAGDAGGERVERGPGVVSIGPQA
jgi:phosphoenolpyruvate-protein kinase (PTS system EI component)